MRKAFVILCPKGDAGDIALEAISSGLESAKIVVVTKSDLLFTVAFRRICRKDTKALSLRDTSCLRVLGAKKKP